MIHDEAGEILLHDWRIDPKQYERHESRRGRRHAYEYLDPARTALVVVDMVPFFLNENPYCRGIVPNICRLADCLREAGGTVAWVLPTEAKLSATAIEFLGEEVAVMFNKSGGEGPLIDRLWHEFEVRPHDIVVGKTASSAFFPGRCELHERLKDRNVDSVIITGTVTNVCCESTVRDASTLDYRVVMVADGCAAVDDQMHNATLQTVYRTFGDVRPTDEVVRLIQSQPSVGSEYLNNQS